MSRVRFRGGGSAMLSAGYGLGVALCYGQVRV